MWGGRTGCEKVLLSCVAIFGIAALTIGILYGIKVNEDAPTLEDICLTEVCAIAGKLKRSFLD